MKKGFSQIELILVIVIISILSAIALTTLYASRDDARISQVIANTRTLLSDMSAFYTATGLQTWRDSDTTVKKVTNVVVLADECASMDLENTPVSNGNDKVFSLCSEGIGTKECLQINTTEEGNVTVSNGSGIDSSICTAIQSSQTIRNLIGTHSFKGSHISR